MRARVTAMVLALNEERNLGPCLDSLAWVDEVLVVDSFSRDRTVEIAESHGARVLQQEFVNYSRQRNWALAHVTHEWVFVVDADERVTPELRAEILAVLENDGDGLAGFSIPRRDYFFGRRIRYCGWQTDRVNRLFRRERGRYGKRSVHEHLELDGPLGSLSAPLEHYTYRTMDQYLEKFVKYTRLGAEDLHRAGRRAGFSELLLRPSARFVKMYVIRLGFLDGLHGLVLCCLAAMSVFMKYARLWALEHETPTAMTPAPVPPADA
jgi:glycosyltransferase involved in cell wall biosynthesis